MNNKFIKHYIEFEEQGLNPTEVSIMSHLYNYGELSFKNNWVKNGMVFVKYLRESLAEQINVSKETVTRTVKNLEAKGWIITKRQRNAATIYFLPKYDFNLSDRKCQFDTLEMANCNQNYTDLKLHNNTVNTESATKNESVVDKVKQWGKTTQQKLGLTFSSIQAIQKFCKNNVEKCKHIVRLILNARNAVAKQNKIVKSEITQFESNLNIKNGLANQLDHIFSYALNLPKGNYAGYVTNALKTYFTQAFGLKTTQVVKPKMHQVKFNNGQKHIHEELPEWAKDDYVYVPDKDVDLKKQAELRAMLDTL
ncbi:MarR family winged helix-turn-helix transcriptional regulator [Apilactobacillus xinyiensis]|uniref:MarR family winged helix-turn-helix transcriptional regulator n=1 Tax=Apilactobacillus xinyiensis TaxID=2841032 RepID=UPI00200DEE06|nr:MarR family transcriptional regulator [Apilactobacillus xinyiensis]MCL0330631.1 MarR family transcriptional regulator [Apilactobacillus xinyiensis]